MFVRHLPVALTLAVASSVLAIESHAQDIRTHAAHTTTPQAVPAPDTGSTAITPRVLPGPIAPPAYHGPKLGVQVVTLNQFVEVVRAFPGTPAHRLGLETGDRILQINGHPIRGVGELQTYLQQAAQFHHGQVVVLIDNVRARHGHWGAQRYVTHATYLDGYAHWAGYPGTSPVTSTAPVTTAMRPQASSVPQLPTPAPVPSPVTSGY